MDARKGYRGGPGHELRPAAVDSSWLEDEWRLQLEGGAAAKARATAAVVPVVETDRPRPRGDGTRLQAQPQAPSRAASAAASAAPSTPWSRVKETLFDYSRTALFHGACFIGDKTCSRTERALWAAATLMSAVLLLSTGWMQYQSFMHSPTVTIIAQNDLPTHAIPFPAVTLCPAKRLHTDTLRTAMESFLSRGLANRTRQAVAANPKEWFRIMSGVNHALTYYQYPNYRLMNLGLRLIGPKLIFLDGFSISQVMMQGRLTCGDLLAHCYWRGVAFSCCDQFQLQRTEMGYCMSFNSRTSTGPKILCTEKNCHHVWSTGPGTGLELVFKTQPKLSATPPLYHKNVVEDLFSRPETDPDYRAHTLLDVWESEEVFLVVNSWTTVNSIKVMVHDRETFPDVNLAYTFSTAARTDYSMAVAFTGTTASEGLRSVPPKKRECLFNGEMQVQMARKYTQSECIAECRSVYIAKSCGCTPYYIEAYRGLFYNGIPECRFSQLSCLAALNLQAVNCSHCIPTCNSHNYEIRIFPSINVKVRDSYLGSTLEISYDMFRTAVMYKQKMAFTKLDTIVAFGGLASLCLGCSLLTGLDILHMLMRVGRAAFGYTVKPMATNSSKGDERRENQNGNVIMSISQIIR